MATNTRAYAAAHFALELDGKDDVGLFRSVEGGSIKAEVMTYQSGSNYDKWRQLGKPKFEDIKVMVGMSMSKPFYSWIEEFFTGKGTRKTGAVVAADYNYEEKARREFSEAMISEIVFPALDGQNKEPAYMGVSLAVENIEFKKGTNKKLSVLNDFAKQKLWTACNFRFKLDGLPSDAFNRVAKIDSFTIKQKIIDYHGGGFRAPIKCPSQMEFPPLSFYVPEIDAQPFMDHFTKRGVKGEIPGRMTGMLEVFDNDASKKVLFTISLAGTDIANVAPAKSESGSEEIKLVKIDIYTESMKFQYKG